jgi:hypothetical protein
VWGTRADKFMAQLPYTLVTPFHSFCMQSEWYD